MGTLLRHPSWELIWAGGLVGLQVHQELQNSVLTDRYVWHRRKLVAAGGGYCRLVLVREGRMELLIAHVGFVEA